MPFFRGERREDDAVCLRFGYGKEIVGGEEKNRSDEKKFRKFFEVVSVLKNRERVSVGFVTKTPRLDYMR